MLLKNKPIRLKKEFLPQRWGQLPNDLILQFLFPQILCVVEMGQVGIYPTLQTQANVLIPHVDVHDVQAVVDLVLLHFHLLHDAPDLVDGKGEHEACHELHPNRVHYLTLVERSYVPVSNGDHRCRGPV